jgi:DNA polymerase-1
MGSSGSTARWRAWTSASRRDASSRWSSENGTSSRAIGAGRYPRLISPKTLTGAELQLDDGPAREAELFLVDGNNLAYRAFFALPEELATTEGFPTNALLGFTNMLFKLLSDYRPKGVAVAWDTRPVHRHEQLETYKGDRRAMPDLLREQFPHFRPIVEAFGYRNLEFEGWEADDVIATLATRAQEAGVRTCVVSTDRDAFQLVSDTVCLMMTPRGVSDVHVYTPERVEARYGIRPDQIPDFIGLKGDSSDNIPGIPGIGDKTAGQLVAQYGSLEEVIAHADELSPARRKNIIEHAEQARISKKLATMRRDLELDFDPAAIVLAPPDRGTLHETFRKFEFRNLLNRVDELEAAVPAAVRESVGTAVPWQEGELPPLRGRVGLAIVDDRFAVATEEGVVVGPWDEALVPRLRDAEVVAHDFKSLPRLTFEPVDDTMIAAYLIEPGRAEYAVDDLVREYGVEPIPEPEAEEETTALVRAAEGARRLAPLLRERLVERGSEHLYRNIELPLTAVLAAMEDAGVKVDEYRMGEITARLRDRVEELEAKAYDLAGEEFMLGSTQQLARILFEKLELTPGRKGKTGYSTDTRVLRAIRGDHEIVPVIEEWRELTKLLNTYLEPLPSLISPVDGRLHTTFNQTVASTGRLSTTRPNLQAIPIRTELGREIRSAFVAEQGHRLLSADYSQVELRILAHVSGEPKLREAFARDEDIHAATAAEVLGKERATLTKDERNIAKMVNFGIIYGISAFGLSENLEIPREQAQEYIDAYLARFPHVQDFIARTIEQAERDGYVTTLLGRRRPVPEIRASNRQTRGLGERLAVNSVMQGTAADIIKVAMVNIHRRLRDEGRRARLVLQVHDELLLEVPDPEVSGVKELVRAEMVGAYPLDPALAVDVGVGDDWNEAKS